MARGEVGFASGVSRGIAALVPEDAGEASRVLRAGGRKRDRQMRGPANATGVSTAARG